MATKKGVKTTLVARRVRVIWTDVEKRTFALGFIKANRADNSRSLKALMDEAQVELPAHLKRDLDSWNQVPWLKDLIIELTLSEVPAPVLEEEEIPTPVVVASNLEKESIVVPTLTVSDVKILLDQQCNSIMDGMLSLFSDLESQIGQLKAMLSAVPASEHSVSVLPDVPVVASIVAEATDVDNFWTGNTDGAGNAQALSIEPAAPQDRPLKGQILSLAKLAVKPKVLIIGITAEQLRQSIPEKLRNAMNYELWMNKHPRLLGTAMEKNDKIFVMQSYASQEIMMRLFPVKDKIVVVKGSISSLKRELKALLEY